MTYINLLAILIGPLLAIFAARWLEHRRDTKSRRMDVFRTLMRTRRNPIDPDHVGALNLVEIEFAKDKAVISAHRILFEHFGSAHPRRADELLDGGMSDNVQQAKNDKFHGRLASERQSLLAKLLHAIAKSLDFKIDQLEIFEGGYSPQGWEDVELEQRIVRRFFVDLYFGNRDLPIAVKDYVNVVNDE